MQYLLLKSHDDSTEPLIVSDALEATEDELARWLGVEVGEVEVLRGQGVLRRTLAGQYPLVESVARFTADEALARLIVKGRVAISGIDPSGFSGHRIGAGLATSAVQARVFVLNVGAQAGHAGLRHARTLQFATGMLFIGNAAGALL